MVGHKPPVDGPVGTQGSSAAEGQRSALTPEEAEVQLQMFKSLADNSREFIGVCDLAFVPFYVNEAGRDLVGLDSLEQACAARVQDFFFPEDQDFITQQFLPRVLTDGRAEVVIRFRHFKTSAALWMIYNVFQIRDAQGRVNGYATVSRDVTQQKRAQEALRASEAKFRSVLEDSLDAAYRRDLRSDTYDYLSPVVERVLGIRPDEMRNLSLSAFVERIHPDDRQQTLDAIEQGMAVATGRLEYRFKADDGEYRWVADNFTVQKNEAGIPVSRGGILRDIGEQKRAQEALKTREREFVEAQRIAKLGSWEWDTRADRVRWSEGLYQLVKLDPSLPAPTYSEQISFYTPESRKRLDAAVERAFGDGTPYELDVEMLRTDGTRMWVTARGEVVRDASGAVEGLRGTVIDITERKQAEARLKESERLYRAIGESIDYGIWICDPQGRNIYASESFLKLVGITQEQCSEFGWGDTLHPDDAEQTIAAWKECSRTGQMWYREHRFRGLDGQWHPVLACGVPVRDEEGRITSWAGINLDISRLKHTEQELRRAKDELAGTNANLEKLVVERTTRLQELVGELEHFSYTITHDMRAPLRAMRGFAEIAGLACDEGDGKAAKEFLRKIMVSGERMDRLITDSLNYSRSVRQELPLEHVDTEQLLRGMLDTYPELQRSRAHIQIDGPLPFVLGNQAGLTQCFSNLLGNSVKFVRPGETPEVRVWAESREGWSRIYVEDKGIGISKEMLPRVFDMFSRGSNKYEGTGIGLALARKVVQRMGGRVGVESEEGKWTRLWLELRTTELKVRLDPEVLSSAESGSGTVLYVEDEETDAMFMRRAFANKGMEGGLRLVGDGRTAIEYLSGAGKFADRKLFPLPEVVLLDLNLPQVPGFEVLRWMRGNPAFARTTVMVLSSSTREDDCRKARELGADGFITKPTSGMEFGRVVDVLTQKWLGK